MKKDFLQFKDYTILIVPDHTSGVKRVRLTSGRIRALLITGGVLSLLFLLFSVGYFSGLQKGWSLERYQTENQNLKVQFKALSEQVTTIQNQLNRVNELDHRIRLAIGIEQSQKADLGVGGPEGDAPAMSQMLPQQEADRIKKIAGKLSQLNNNLDNQELSLDELDAYLEDNEALIMATPSIWPVRGWVTTEFGMRTSPFGGTYTLHQGIDIATTMGTLIRTPASGIVTYAGWDSGYGNLVVISHGYGLSTKFGHCAEILVKKGDAVRRGQGIATVGATGRATGPHLHYEILIHGVPVNPRRYVFE